MRIDQEQELGPPPARGDALEKASAIRSRQWSLIKSKNWMTSHSAVEKLFQPALG
jgi:hypothetical protein